MRILGIDLGSVSVKAVEVDTAFGRYDIHDYHEATIPFGSDPREAIQRLIKGLAKQPDRVVVCLRSGQATFRNLQLPTRDKKAIQASVGFELDDDLPFPLEQSAYDYSQLSQAGTSTHVHVATTMRKYVEEAIARWSASGIDPDIVTTEAWAFRALLNRILAAPAQEQPILLAHIGHTRTTLYLHWRGFPVASREIRWGGVDLTTAICKKYNIPMDQAEQAKLDHGFVLTRAQRENATAEQIDFADTLLQPLRDLVRELRQIALTCKSVTHANMSAIYLAGGTSLLPGLGPFLEEEFQLRVSALQALSSAATSGVTYNEQTDAGFALAAALGISQVKSPDRSTGINLRKGSMAKLGGGREFSMAALKRPLLALGLIGACMFASLLVQSSSYQARIAEVDSQLERSVRSFFGTVSSSAMRTYMSSTSTLRSSITKEMNKERDLGRLLSPNPHSPLGFLADASTSIPGDLVVDMTQFQVGASPSAPYSTAEGTSASLTFLVSNPQVAERLANLMGNKLAGMQRSKIEETMAPDGTSKRWKITFSGKPTEESYGR